MRGRTRFSTGAVTAAIGGTAADAVAREPLPRREQAAGEAASAAARSVAKLPAHGHVPFGLQGRGVARDLDAAVVEERAGGARVVGQGLAVVGQGGDLREDGRREVVLPRQDEEVRREADVVALLLGGELRLGGGASRLRGADALGGRVEREDGVAHVDGDELFLPPEEDLGLALLRLRDRDVALRGAVEDGDGEGEADRGVRETALADRPDERPKLPSRASGTTTGPPRKPVAGAFGFRPPARPRRA